MARNISRASSQYLDASVLPVSAYPVSFACWFNPQNFNNDPNGLLILSRGTTNSDCIGLMWNDSGGSNPTVSAVINNNGTVTEALHATALSTSTWYHATAVFSSATSYSIYLNGANKVSQNNSNAFPSSMDRVLMGSIFISSQRLTSALLAEAGIWNVALTDDEALALARGASPMLVRPGALRFYSNLFGNASPEPNKYGAALTLVNSPTKADHPRIIYPSGLF
jgi:hypothetical protein